MGFPYLALVLSCAAVFVICDALSAAWGKSGDPWYLTLVFALAPLGYLLFGIINNTRTLSVSSGLVNSVIVISTVFIGIFYFGDELTIKQTLGLVCAVAAILLVS